MNLIASIKAAVARLRRSRPAVVVDRGARYEPRLPYALPIW